MSMVKFALIKVGSAIMTVIASDVYIFILEALSAPERHNCNICKSSSQVIRVVKAIKVKVTCGSKVGGAGCFRVHPGHRQAKPIPVKVILIGRVVLKKCLVFEFYPVGKAQGLNERPNKSAFRRKIAEFFVQGTGCCVKQLIDTRQRPRVSLCLFLARCGSSLLT